MAIPGRGRDLRCCFAFACSPQGLSAEEARGIRGGRRRLRCAFPIFILPSPSSSWWWWNWKAGRAGGPRMPGLSEATSTRAGLTDSVYGAHLSQGRTVTTAVMRWGGCVAETRFVWWPPFACLTPVCRAKKKSV